MLSLGDAILGEVRGRGAVHMGGATGSDIMERPVNRMTDRCNNITVPKVCLRAVIIEHIFVVVCANCAVGFQQLSLKFTVVGLFRNWISWVNGSLEANTGTCKV